MVLFNSWYFGHSKLNLLSKNRYFLYDLMFCKVLVHENVLCLSEVCLCLFKVSIILKESAIKSNYIQYNYLSSLIYQGIHINCVHIFFFFSAFDCACQLFVQYQCSTVCFKQTQPHDTTNIHNSSQCSKLSRYNPLQQITLNVN